MEKEKIAHHEIVVSDMISLPKNSKIEETYLPRSSEYISVPWCSEMFWNLEISRTAISFTIPAYRENMYN